MRWTIDSNNPIVCGITKVLNCIWLSVFWLIACLPVFTIGSSTKAMFAVVRRNIRRDEGTLLRTFWRTFREDFLRTTVCSLVGTAIFLVLFVDALVFSKMDINGEFMGKLYWAVLVLVALEATWFTYLFAYVERFTGGVKDTLRFSLRLIVLHPAKSITILAILAGSVIVIAWAPVLILIVPTVSCLLCSTVTESVFALYVNEKDRQLFEDGMS